MPKFKKRVLQVGTYHSPDGVVDVTPQRLKHWATSFKRMRDSGIRVPVSWDHDDDPSKSVPVEMSSGRRKRSAAGTVGYLDSFDLSDDGKSASVTLDIRRKEDAEKVRSNLAYFSPVIYGQWKDGKGQTHKDCITHGDLVQHPVDHSQGEFEPAAVACALRMGLDQGKPRTYRFQAEQEMADDNNESDGVVSNENNRLSKVRDALAAMNIVLSDDTTEENFLEHLEQALLTVAAMEGEGDIDMGTENLEAENPEFAAMSLEVRKWRGHADQQHRDQVAKRLSSLLESGRCTPAEHKQQLSSIKAVRLSLDANGSHRPSALESWISSREAVPQGTFWDSETRTRMSQLEPVPQPPHVRGAGDMTDEEADAIVNTIFQR